MKIIAVVLGFSTGVAVLQTVQQASQEDIAEFEKDVIASGSAILVAATFILTIGSTLCYRTYKVQNVIEPVTEISKKQFSRVFSPFISSISVTLASFVTAVGVSLLTPSTNPEVQEHTREQVLGGFTAYLADNSPTPLGYSLLVALAATVLYIFTSGREPYCELLDEYDKITRQQPADTTAQYSREYSSPEEPDATEQKEHPAQQDLAERLGLVGIITICAATLLLALFTALAPTKKRTRANPLGG